MRPIAMVRGSAKEMLAAAEALEALERGEATAKELPARVVVNPTREQIDEEFQALGEAPPSWPLPADGWRSPVFMTVKAEAAWLQQPVSMVSNATDTKTYSTTIGEVLTGVRDGKWAKRVARVRDAHAKALGAAEEDGMPDPVAEAKKAVHRLKAKLPAVAFSGTFSTRKDEAVESHSGFLCVDIDGCNGCVEMRGRLAHRRLAKG